MKIMVRVVLARHNSRISRFYGSIRIVSLPTTQIVPRLGQNHNTSRALNQLALPGYWHDRARRYWSADESIVNPSSISAGPFPAAAGRVPTVLQLLPHVHCRRRRNSA